MPAGLELDALIHQILGRTVPAHVYPSYSTDRTAIDESKKELESILGIRIVAGQTHMRGWPWFARYETNPSDGTEVLAETYPLAICRLALLKKLKGQGAVALESPQERA